MLRFPLNCILTFRALFALFCVVAASPSSALTPPFHWIQTAGRAFEFGPGRGVAVDDEGNYFMSGTVRDGANFSGTVLTTRGPSDFFVAKYNPAGGLVWVRNAGGLNENAAHEDIAYGVDVDAMGNCYVTGQFGDSASFDTTSVFTKGQTDVFIAKYDPAGNLLWVSRAGSPGQDGGNDIAVTDAGYSYITGFLGGTGADFGDTTLASAEGHGFVAKYGPDGVFRWVSLFSGAAHVRGRTVALTPAGDCVVVGVNNGTAMIGDSVFTSSFDGDGFIAKFSASGVFQWALQSKPPDVMTAVSVDATSALFAVGRFFEPFFERNGMYLGKFDGQGQPLWEKTLLGTGIGADVVPLDVAVNADGGLFTTGWFDGETTFGDTTVTPVSVDLFLAAYDTSGTIVDFVHGGNGPEIIKYGQAGVDVDVGQSGNVVVHARAEEVFAVADTVIYFEGMHHVLIAFSDIAAGVTHADAPGVNLSQNFPNPFNPGTVIRYHLPEPLFVRIDIYDVSGRHVRSLVQGFFPAGHQVVTWDGITDEGVRAAAGAYFYRLDAGGITRTRKMILIK